MIAAMCYSSLLVFCGCYDLFGRNCSEERVMLCRSEVCSAGCFVDRDFSRISPSLRTTTTKIKRTRQGRERMTPSISQTHTFIHTWSCVDVICRVCGNSLVMRAKSCTVRRAQASSFKNVNRQQCGALGSRWCSAPAE